MAINPITGKQFGAISGDRLGLTGPGGPAEPTLEDKQREEARKERERAGRGRASTIVAGGRGGLAGSDDELGFSLSRRTLLGV